MDHMMNSLPAYFVEHGVWILGSRSHFLPALSGRTGNPEVPHGITQVSEDTKIDVRAAALESSLDRMKPHYRPLQLECQPPESLVGRKQLDTDTRKLLVAELIDSNDTGL